MPALDLNRIQSFALDSRLPANIQAPLRAWHTGTDFRHLSKNKPSLGGPTHTSLIDITADSPRSFLTKKAHWPILFGGNWNPQGEYFGDDPHQAFNERAVYPCYLQVKATRRPMAHKVRMHTSCEVLQYDRLILPYRDDDKESLLIFSWLEFIIPYKPNEKKLSGREHSCLLLLGAGYTAKQVAYRLGIAERTAEHHIESAKRKLGARNTAHAISIMFLRHLLMEDPQQVRSPPHLET